MTHLKIIAYGMVAVFVESSAADEQTAGSLLP